MIKELLKLFLSDTKDGGHDSYDLEILVITSLCWNARKLD